MSPAPGPPLLQRRSMPTMPNGRSSPDNLLRRLLRSKSAVDLEFGLQRLPRPGDPTHSCVKLRFRWAACCCNSSWWIDPDCLIEPVPFRGHPPQDVKIFYWVLPFDDFGYCPRCFVILGAHAVPIAQMMHVLYGPDDRFRRIQNE
jgi:hypothetical protein